MIQSGRCQTIVGGLLDRIRIEDADLIDAQNLYLMLGTSSAALIGLLFVATSPHLVEVVSSPAFRSAHTTYPLSSHVADTRAMWP